MNLALNAREAVRNGGAEDISTYAARWRRWRPGATSLRYCVLSVKDVGPGVSPEVRDRILEPFFTTREGGSGLGLAIVHGIARRHGAHLEIVSAPGEGSTFRVWFPSSKSGARPQI